tara:strand:+ start:589 stop:819 length:231 start_codon:yes stop_codon:yes gene_type:complete
MGSKKNKLVLTKLHAWLFFPWILIAGLILWFWLGQVDSNSYALKIALSIFCIVPIGALSALIIAFFAGVVNMVKGH